MRKIVFLLIAFVVMTGYSYAQDNSNHQATPTPPVMVKSVINTTHSSGCNFLVLEDNLPWSSSAITDILTEKGETFSVANSATFPGLDFSLFDVIVVASDQNPDFHTAFVANFDKFVTFVLGGGSLEVHAATCGHNSECVSVNLPGGVSTVSGRDVLDHYNLVANPAHPITAGVTSPFYGNYASHGYFVNLAPGTEIITTTQSLGQQPTTIQYHYGAGVVTATTCTYEFGYSVIPPQQAGLMLQNNLNYSCGHATVPTLSEWGLIFLGLALLGFGTFYILKMRG
jgi:hypothetical protein